MKEKMFEIEILVEVKFEDGSYDMDIINFHIFGINKHKALFNLIRRNLLHLIIEKHNERLAKLIINDNSYDKFWNCVFEYQLVDLLKIKRIF